MSNLPSSPHRDSEPKVVTVILNTNRKRDTLTCLGSVLAATYKNHSVLVLDNQSDDGSVETIRAAYPEVEIIELRENRGYAGNNNVGIGAAVAAGANWVFVLNEDTVVAEDCVARLVEAGESDPRIGVVGPMVYHHDEPGIIQSAGGRIGPGWQSLHLGQNEPDRNQFRTPHRVDWISGCGIMVRREVIEQVGMLDPRYFYYWEETEWCLRARRGGWLVVHVPQAKIWHKGVQRDYRPSPSVTYYATRNRLLTMAKHQASMAAWLRALAELARTLGSWTLLPKWKHQGAHRHAMWRGISDFLCRRWGGPVRL